MTLARQQSLFTYNSSSGGVTYYFDITVDAQGLITVGNIRSSLGSTDCSTGIPDSVLDDISAAKLLVQQLVSETSVDSGIITFTGQTEQPIVFVPGDLNNTDYRVAYTTSDGTILVTEDKTILGCNAVADFVYGSVADPKTVNYVILVKTQQAGVTSGTLVFLPADAGVETVTFSSLMTTDDYHVILSEEGFFAAALTSKTKAGFTVQLGYTVPTGQSASVGYDVFVS